MIFYKDFVYLLESEKTFAHFSERITESDVYERYLQTIETNKLNVFIFVDHDNQMVIPGKFATTKIKIILDKPHLSSVDNGRFWGNFVKEFK